MTALHYASREGHSSCVELLLTFGSIQVGDGPDVVELREGSLVDAKDRWGDIKRGKISKINDDNKFDIDYDDGKKETDVPRDRIRALQLALKTLTGKTYLVVLESTEMTIGAIKEKVAADVGISVDQQVFVFGGQGLPNDQTLGHNGLLLKKVEGHPFEIPTVLLLENSMITALENNDMATIGAYLDAIALSPTFADDDGASYVDIAAHAGLASLVSVLLDRGCVSEGNVKGGWTTVHFASSLGNTEVLTVLLSRGFDRHKPDKASICILTTFCRNVFF